MSRTCRLLSLLGALLGTAAFMMAQAPSIPDNFVQLDGNSILDRAPNPCTSPGVPFGCTDDWNLLNGNGVGAHPGVAGGSLARSFISGAASINIFTTGGSKDPLDVTSWKWKNGGTPDKDAITNGYAAAYQDPGNGHLILAFGADRFAVNGDANIGLWFFQQDVHPVPVGGTGGGFSGAHTLNDIFIVSAFTQGGGVSTITVYTWDPDCARGVRNPAPGGCAETNLRLRFSSVPAANCTNVAEGCADVNSGPIDVSWPYLSKFGNGSTLIPAGGFYEGGLDVTELLGGNIECFTSFLIETRSAQTPSAVLKDFVAGNFNICGLNATKTCSATGGVLNAAGTSIHYLFNGTVTNVGVGGLSNVTVVDSLPAGSSNVVFKQGAAAVPPAVPGTATTTVTASTCPTTVPATFPAGAVCANLGSLDSQAVENWSVEFDSTSLNVQNNGYAEGAAGGSSPGACTDSGTVCSDPPLLASCSTSPTNSIIITKSCAVPTGYPNAILPGTQLTTLSGHAVVQVNFSGEVCNTGDTPLTGVTLTDSPGATISPLAIPTLAAAGQTGACVKYSGNYLPSGVGPSDLGAAAGRYSFADEIKVTGAVAGLGSTSPGADGTCLSAFTTGAQACAAATCNICPAGATCQGN